AEAGEASGDRRRAFAGKQDGENPVGLLAPDDIAASDAVATALSPIVGEGPRQQGEALADRRTTAAIAVGSPDATLMTCQKRDQADAMRRHPPGCGERRHSDSCDDMKGLAGYGARHEPPPSIAGGRALVRCGSDQAFMLGCGMARTEFRVSILL